MIPKSFTTLLFKWFLYALVLHQGSLLSPRKCFGVWGKLMKKLDTKFCNNIFYAAHIIKHSRPWPGPWPWPRNALRVKINSIVCYRMNVLKIKLGTRELLKSVENWIMTFESDGWEWAQHRNQTPHTDSHTPYTRNTTYPFSTLRHPPCLSWYGSALPHARQRCLVCSQITFKEPKLSALK